jgi:hypothetical protein
MESPSDRTIQAALLALRNPQPNLVETIARIVKIQQSLPIGEQRDQLLDEISCLDVISEVMKRAMEGIGTNVAVNFKEGL